MVFFVTCLTPYSRCSTTSSVNRMVESVLLSKKYIFRTPLEFFFFMPVRNLIPCTVPSRSKRTSSKTPLGHTSRCAFSSTGKTKSPTQRLRCGVSHFCLCCNKVKILGLPVVSKNIDLKLTCTPRRPHTTSI